MTPTFTTSELFARSQGAQCLGNLECHWCGSPCSNLWPHDDDPPIPFVRSKSTAKRPGNSTICVGCWLFRRRRITIPFLRGNTFRDGRCAVDFSWWITDKGAWAIENEDKPALLDHLLLAPCRFAMSLLRDNRANLLQLAVPNENPEVKAETPLHFTVDSVPYTYTIYELKRAIANHDANGKHPGVRAILDWLGEEALPAPNPTLGETPEQKRGRGRPTKAQSDETLVKQVICLSGNY